MGWSGKEGPVPVRRCLLRTRLWVSTYGEWSYGEGAAPLYEVKYSIQIKKERPSLCLLYWVTPPFVTLRRIGPCRRRRRRRHKQSQRRPSPSGVWSDSIRWVEKEGHEGLRFHSPFEQLGKSEVRVGRTEKRSACGLDGSWRHYGKGPSQSGWHRHSTWKGFVLNTSPVFDRSRSVQNQICRVICNVVQLITTQEQTYFTWFLIPLFYLKETG